MERKSHRKTTAMAVKSTLKNKRKSEAVRAPASKKLKKAVAAPAEPESDDSDVASDSPDEAMSSADDLDNSSGAQESDDNDSDGSEDELDNSDNDELDNSDEEDELDNSDDDEEDEENGQSKNAGKTEEEKKKERAEQKKLREERKMSRPQGEKIQQIKQLWERLRVRKDMPADVRKKLVEETWELSKDSIKDIIFKHDASRVIQTLFKYSDKTKRAVITKELKGNYVNLAKSPYGKYLLVKILHYGNSEVRQNVLNELHGNFRKLMGHREGAYVIEDFYRDYSTAQQKKQIIREFYGSEFALFRDVAMDKSLKEIIAENPDKRPYLMKNLKETITKAVQKGSIGFTIIHAAMLEYVTNLDLQSSDREEFVDLVSEQFAEMVHTDEGAKTAAIVLSIATAKERKALVKSLKPFATNLAKDENGQFVLITLFNTVDDTVLVPKQMLPDLKENMVELLQSKTGRRPFLYLLVGRAPRYFSPAVQKRFAEIDELKKNTSKKDDEARRLELRKSFSPVILEIIAANAPELLKETLSSQFISEALLFADGDKDAALQAVADAFRGSPENESHLIHQAFSPRLLRALIQDGVWNNAEKRVVKIETPTNFKSAFYAAIADDAVAWASSSSGSFVVVALLENLEGSERSELVKTLKKSKKSIAATADDNKGAKLILESLK